MKSNFFINKITQGRKSLREKSTFSRPFAFSFLNLKGYLNFILYSSKLWLALQYKYVCPSCFGLDQKCIFTTIFEFRRIPKTVWTGPKAFGPIKNSFGFIEGQGIWVNNWSTFVKYCLFRDIGILKLNIHHRFQEKSISNFKIQIFQCLKI